MTRKEPGKDVAEILFGVVVGKPDKMLVEIGRLVGKCLQQQIVCRGFGAGVTGIKA